MIIKQNKQYKRIGTKYKRKEEGRRFRKFSLHTYAILYYRIISEYMERYAIIILYGYSNFERASILVKFNLYLMD